MFDGFIILTFIDDDGNDDELYFSVLSSG